MEMNLFQYQSEEYEVNMLIDSGAEINTLSF